MICLDNDGMRECVIPLTFGSETFSSVEHSAFYQKFCVEGVDIVQEVQKYITEPLKHYSEDITDIYPIALSRALEVNVVVFRSTPEVCHIQDLYQDGLGYEATI